MRRRSAKPKLRKVKVRSSMTVEACSAERTAGGQSIDRVAAIVIIFFLQLAIIIRPLVSEAANGPGANFLVELPIIFACCLWLIAMVLKGELRFAITRLEVPIAAFVIFIIISVFTSSYKRPSFILAIDWISFIILFFTLVNVIRGTGVVRLLLAALIASTFVVSLYGLYQHFYVQGGVVETLNQLETEAKKRYPGNDDAAARYVVSEIGKRFGIYDIRPEALSDFSGRVRSGDVYSTFTVANNLAGFLILVFPLQLGFLVDYLRRMRAKHYFSLEDASLSVCSKPRSEASGVASGTTSVGLESELQATSRAERSFKVAVSVSVAGIMVVTSITTLLCLYLTGSKGGWIALILGMILFCALSVRRKYVLSTAALVLILAIGSAQLGGKLPKLSEYLGSMTIRADYWRAAWEIIKDHPWLGIGLDNYGDYGTAYKGPEEGESQKAHNDFVQIWAETGTFGFLAYCSLWIVFLLLCFRGELTAVCSKLRSEASGVASGSRAKFETKKPPPLEASQQEFSALLQESDSHLWSVGLIAGIAAFFLNYIAKLGLDASFILTLLFGVAWLVAYISFASDPHPASNNRLPSYFRYGIITGLCCFLIHSLVDFDLYVHGIAQNVWMLMAFALVVRSDSGNGFMQFRRKVGIVSQLVIAVAATLLIGAVALVLVPRAFTVQIYLENGERLYVNGKIKESIHNWESAAELDSWDATIQKYLSDAYEQLAYVERGETHKYRNLAMAYIKRAIELNPRIAMYHAALGQLYEHDNQIAEALKEYKRATQLFPSKPIYWFYLAQAYQKDGKFEEAKKLYIHALDLNKRQRYPRNELPPKIREAIERRLAKGFK